MRRLRIFFTVAAVLALPRTAMAEIDTAGLLKMYDSGDQATRMLTLSNLGGVQDGLSWANATLMNVRKEKPLYCQPSKMRLTDAQTLDILRQFAADHPDKAKLPFGLTLLFALQEVFPC